jgi:hypothetical protein
MLIIVQLDARNVIPAIVSFAYESIMLCLRVAFSILAWCSVNPGHVPGYLQYVLPSRSSMEIQSSVGPTSDQSSRTYMEEKFIYVN